jgi:hypothetical protein
MRSKFGRKALTGTKLNRSETTMTFARDASVLIFSPFVVALTLIVAMVLSRWTGFGPSSNTYASAGVAAIAVGLIVGVISLFLAKSIRVRWRLLIALLYVPVTMFSLVMAGL